MRILQINILGIGIFSLPLLVLGTTSITSCSDSEGNNLKRLKESDSMITEESKKVKGFKINIEKNTLENKDFRKVLYTSTHSQLVLMSLKPKEEIGEEIHPDIDQFFRFEGGKGKCIIDGTEYEVKDGDAIIIPAGAKHNVINTDASKELKMYTIYSPPHHKDGTVQKTKKDAETSKEEYDGVTSERN
ncbi:cupin domain-containing protein [Sporocytophaga myxococcoides]|nr:cupin domain-containing protein [Sporocytophaga myxococcoides]